MSADEIFATGSKCLFGFRQLSLNRGNRTHLQRAYVCLCRCPVGVINLVADDDTCARKIASGTKYTSQICNPRTKPFSAEELARQNKFKSAAQATVTALADPVQKAAYEVAFNTQKKYKTLRGYVFAQEYANLAQ